MEKTHSSKEIFQRNSFNAEELHLISVLFCAFAPLTISCLILNQIVLPKTLLSSAILHH